MAVCVEFDVNGNLVAADPQPATFETCTLVVLSGPEHAANPFVLTVEEGGLIGGAIMLGGVAIPVVSALRDDRSLRS